MTLNLPRFTAHLAAPTEEDPDATTEHAVSIRHVDQLRAELEAPKHGLAAHDGVSAMEAAPLHFTTLWVWAALTREGVITDKFQEFKGRVVALEEGKTEEPVDPTVPAAATDSP